MEKFDLANYQGELKKILFTIDEVLTKGNLKYTIAYGTLLGAIREGDIIPWDDDIDIFVMRSEFDAACDLIRKQCPDLYVWDWNHDEKCDLPFARVFNRIRDGQTLEFYRAYVDIYVMDFAPDNYILQKISPLLWVPVWRLINLKSGHKLGWPRFSLTSCILYFCMIPFCFFNIPTLKKLYAHLKGSFFTTGKFVWHEHQSKKTVFPAASFVNPIRVKFGDLNVLAPSDYDKLLEMCYGDWRTPPKAIKDRGQHAYTNDGVELAT